MASNLVTRIIEFRDNGLQNSCVAGWTTDLRRNRLGIWMDNVGETVEKKDLGRQPIAALLRN